MKKLFVGNLSWDATDNDLKDIFSKFGELSEVTVLKERDTNRSKGFGFVTFANDSEADTAVNEMHGKEYMGRNLTVNEARPREDRPQQRRSFR